MHCYAEKLLSFLAKALERVIKPESARDSSELALATKPHRSLSDTMRTGMALLKNMYATGEFLDVVLVGLFAFGHLVGFAGSAPCGLNT